MQGQQELMERQVQLAQLAQMVKMELAITF
jgi:hypothetical protein